MEEGTMSKLRFSIAISLDGYVAGPGQSEENPIGIGGDKLHEWLIPLKVFKEMHGQEVEGAEVNASDDVVRGRFTNVGSSIMGRRMFGPVSGPWGEDPWRGWWGEEPPFHHPVFVLTHHEREPLELVGTTFHFVTDGIESALEQAKEAAGGRDVAVAGGASVARQYLAAGLLNEIDLSIVPALLGGGERLFEEIEVGDVQLEQLGAVEAPGVTHVKYRVEHG
jgi:dihydrofolate reductase